ncbi:MAG: polyprenol monophosphomannose synthase [Bdellovibrionota bacterium]
MKTLIIIPTYNEIENIKKLTTEVFQQVDSQTHILIVDDNSPDGTGDLADVLASSNPRIHVLHRPRKLGLGTAYVAGFRYGLDNGFDVFFEMDSDFSHDPKYLPVFQQEIERCDAVIGSRYITGGGVVNWGLGRRVLSRGGSLYAKFLLGLPFRDLTGGFNCWRRSVIEAIGPNTLKSDGYAFQIEMKYKAYKKGFRLKEVPIVFEDRYLGQSKMNKKIVVEAMYRVLLMRVNDLSIRKLLPDFKTSSSSKSG